MSLENNFSDRFKAIAGVVEKFVENNLMEKEHRDENFRKLAMAFEAFVKESPLRQNISRVARAGQVFADAATNPSANAHVAAERPSTMLNVSVQVKKLANFKGELPKYQTELASGLDVRAQLDEAITVAPGARVLVPTGLAVAIPQGYEIQARPRSGWAIRDGVSLLNTPGTIDADYRGEIKIIVINLGDKDVVINDQDRVAQLVVCPVIQAAFEVVGELSSTDRGAGGFGSTGRG